MHIIFFQRPPRIEEYRVECNIVSYSVEKDCRQMESSPAMNNIFFQNVSSIASCSVEKGCKQIATQQ